MPDIPGDSTTTSSVAVGSAVTGSLEVAFDRDWFRIDLVAGQTIRITLNAAGTVPLSDPYLRVRDSSGTQIAENDDSGGTLDSLINFTASATGTYYIDVGGYENATGDYSLSVNPFTPPPLASLSHFASHLTHGYWNGNSHHFAVTQGGSLSVNLVGLTVEGANVARLALRQWSDVIGINFVEVASGGQIVFDDSEEGASCRVTYSNGITTSATINVSTKWLSDYGSAINTYGYQTYLHEIGHALGLGHAGHYNNKADYPNDATFLNDSWAMSVMSYFSQTENGYFADQGFSRSYLGTPMVADIAAISVLYGLSTTTRAGATTYGFGSNAGDVFNASLYPTIAYTIFDSGGIDTLDYSGFAASQLIELTSGEFSNVGGRVGNVNIAIGTVIENAIAGAGNDILRGNAANNVLTGNGGNDLLFGAGGNNVLEGGTGIDTAEFASARSANSVFALGETAAVVNLFTRQTDRTHQVEILRFQDISLDTSTLSQFAALGYIAGYDDLVRTFGADAESGFIHFAYNGIFEGRVQDGFDGFQYLAGYDDLIIVLGPNETAAAEHFIKYGFAEGRPRDSFDGFAYLAAYDDLIGAFGADESAAARHFVSYGFSEGRPRDAFDGIQYIAGYHDLIDAFGADEQAGTQHFVANGWREGRSRDAFNADQYLDNYADLRTAFGDDHHAATLHFIYHGYSEGRTDMLI